MKKVVNKIYSYSVFYELAPGGGYVAMVPTLPGCHTQGENFEEAEKNIKEAIELYLESLIERKEKIKEEFKSFIYDARLSLEEFVKLL
jgi:predicted RNase H-like HicB family nuclease